MRIIWTIIFVLLFCKFGFSQLNLSIFSTLNDVCDGVDCRYDGPTILINEVQVAPSDGDGSIWQSDCSMPTPRCGEWIELYNPHLCRSADISHYFLGNHSGEMGGGSYSGGILIPAGTVIPPRGFCVIRGRNAPQVSPELLIANGGNTVELIVDGLFVRTCVGTGGSGRVWFPNDGGWFAFYDRNGVPQDAISWGSVFHSCQSCSPCTPSGSSFSGILPSYTDIPSNRKAIISSGIVSMSALTYRRNPDGSAWDVNRRMSTMGRCNAICDDKEPIITCTGTATVSVNGETGYYSYLWDDSRAQTTATATGLCAGIYTVTVTDEYNVTATATVEVSDFVPEITLPHYDPVCINMPAFQWGGIIPAGGELTGPGVSGFTFNPAAAGAGTHQLTYFYTGAHGCHNSAQVSIIVHALPSLDLPENRTYCVGDSVPSISFTGADVSNIIWSAPGGRAIGLSGNNGTESIPGFRAIHNSNDPVSVTVTFTSESVDGNCEEDSKIFILTVNPLPVLDLPIDIPFCTGETFPIFHFTGDNIGEVTWRVVSSTGKAINIVKSGKNFIPAFDAVNDDFSSEIITITTTPVSPLGCSGETKNFTVSIHPLPVLNDPRDITLYACRASAPIFLISPNADTIIWKVISGSGAAIGMPESGTGTIHSFIAVNTGTSPVPVTIAVTPKSTAGCMGETKTFTITVNPVAALIPPKDIALCAGETSSIIYLSNANIDAIGWEVLGDSWEKTGMTAKSGMDSIPAFTPVNNSATPDTITIELTPVFFAGCEGESKTFAIIINPSPTLHPISDVTLCPDENTPPISFSGINVNSVTWEAPDGVTIGMNLSSGIGNIAPFTTINTGNTDITVTVVVTPVSLAGCTGEAKTFNIKVDAKAVLDIHLGNDTIICRLDSLFLDAEHPHAKSYQWQDDSKKATYTVYHEAGQFWVVVTGHCNEAKGTIDIMHYKDLTVNLGNDLVFCEDDMIYKKLDVYTPLATSYLWHDGSELPTYIVDNFGIYSVTVSNVCMSVWDEIEVKIKDCSALKLWIPNAFTPGGVNDVFKPEISNPELLVEYEMAIYNRWGTLVFSTRDYLTGWNGKDSKGKDCRTDIYTGIIQYREHERNFAKTFSVMLLR